MKRVIHSIVIGLFCCAAFGVNAQRTRTPGQARIVPKQPAEQPTPNPAPSPFAPKLATPVQCKECAQAVAVLEQGAVYSIAVDISKAMPNEKPQIVGLILTGAKNQNKTFSIPLGYGFAPGPKPATSPGEEFEIMV